MEDENTNESTHVCLKNIKEEYNSIGTLQKIGNQSEILSNMWIRGWINRTFGTLLWNFKSSMVGFCFKLKNGEWWFNNIF